MLNFRIYFVSAKDYLFNTKSVICCYLIAALIGFGYWGFSIITWPTESILIKLLYRFTDPEYYPYIVNLAKLNFHEFVNIDLKDRWGILFPIAGILPYSISVSLFGLMGFVFTDIVIGIVRLYLYDLLLKCLRIKRSLVYALMLLFFSSDVVVSSISQSIGINFTGLWTDRIPRDYVTSLFLTSQFILIARKNIVLRMKWGLLIFLIPIALLLHSDVHTFLILSPVVLSCSIQFYKKNYSRYYHSILSGVMFLITSFLFFALININISVDLKERWGQYSTISNLLSFQTVSREKILISIGTFLVVTAISRYINHPFNRRILMLCRASIYLIGISLIASPILSFFLKKNIQDYQFPIRTDVFITFNLLFSLLFFISLLKQKFPLLVIRFKFPLFLLSMWLFSSYSFARWNRQVNINSQPSVVSSWGMFESKNYHSDLVKLDEYLNNFENSNKVLLTFDHHLSLYWLFKGDRYLFLGDPIWSNQETEMLYTRFFNAMKILKANKEETKSLLSKYYYQLRFITGGALQGNRLHLKFPIEQYSKENFVQIWQSLDNWGLVIPESYVDTKLHNYSNVELTMKNPDFIIINRSYPIVNRNESDFSICHSSETFLVYCLVR